MNAFSLAVKQDVGIAHRLDIFQQASIVLA